MFSKNQLTRLILATLIGCLVLHDQDLMADPSDDEIDALKLKITSLESEHQKFEDRTAEIIKKVIERMAAIEAEAAAQTPAAVGQDKLKHIRDRGLGKPASVGSTSPGSRHSTADLAALQQELIDLRREFLQFEERNAEIFKKVIEHMADIEQKLAAPKQ